MKNAPNSKQTNFSRQSSRSYIVFTLVAKIFLPARQYSNSTFWHNSKNLMLHCNKKLHHGTFFWQIHCEPLKFRHFYHSLYVLEQEWTHFRTDASIKCIVLYHKQSNLSKTRIDDVYISCLNLSHFFSKIYQTFLTDGMHKEEISLHKKKWVFYEKCFLRMHLLSTGLQIGLWIAYIPVDRLCI